MGGFFTITFRPVSVRFSVLRYQYVGFFELLLLLSPSPARARSLSLSQRSKN
jgi:hypothetical protein